MFSKKRLGVIIMKKILLTSAAALGLFVMSAGAIFAAPYNPNFVNPQVVAFYTSGPHGIPSETCSNHYGFDLVMRDGNSGNFQEWSYGSTPCDENGVLHGDHDLWQISKDGTCPDKATTIPNAYPGWGSYLTPGATYCVLNNDFHVNK